MFAVGSIALTWHKNVVSVRMTLKVDCVIENAVTAEVTEETFVVLFAEPQMGIVEKAENSVVP